MEHTLIKHKSGIFGGGGSGGGGPNGAGLSALTIAYIYGCLLPEGAHECYHFSFRRAFRRLIFLE
jgi:hypothetical protein